MSNSKTQETSLILLLKWPAIDASPSERDTLTWAVLNAEQSFAPSPHIKVIKPSFLKASTNKALWFGAIRAKTLPFFNTSLKASWALLNNSSFFFMYRSLSKKRRSNVGPDMAIPNESSLQRV